MMRTHDIREPLRVGDRMVKERYETYDSKTGEVALSTDIFADVGPRWTGHASTSVLVDKLSPADVEFHMDRVLDSVLESKSQ